MNRRAVIGVMGAGEQASPESMTEARSLGRLIAEHGWVLLSGGRNAGVMDAVNQGARAAGGLTVGILPTNDLETVSDAVDVAIFTDMGSARNNINVLSSDVVVACGVGGAGTASEIALALKAKKPVVLLSAGRAAEEFFRSIGGALVVVVSSADAAVREAERIVKERRE